MCYDSGTYVSLRKYVHIFEGILQSYYSLLCTERLNSFGAVSTLSALVLFPFTFSIAVFTAQLMANVSNGVKIDGNRVVDMNGKPVKLTVWRGKERNGKRHNKDECVL